jgi:hypothetical protein
MMLLRGAFGTTHNAKHSQRFACVAALRVGS